MEEALRRAVDGALLKFFSNIESLTPQQFEILKSLFLHRKDTLAILPTGHGKSLPFQVAPFVAIEVSGPRPCEIEGEVSFKHLSNRSIVIVVSPLLAIMDTQAKELNNIGTRDIIILRFATLMSAYI